MRHTHPLILTDKGVIKYIEDRALAVMSTEQMREACILEAWKKYAEPPRQYEPSEVPPVTGWFGPETSTHLRMGLIDILIKRHMRNFQTKEQMVDKFKEQRTLSEEILLGSTC